MTRHKFSIGDYPSNFHGPDIIIKSVRYKGTPGLCELLFKNNPIGCNKKDGNEYLDILKRTNILYNKHNPKLLLNAKHSNA